MSIPWMKIDTTLPNKPVVQHVRRATKSGRWEALGLIVAVLAWADGITEDGVCEGYTAEDLDDLFAKRGLAAGLANAGWITTSAEGWIAFPEWEVHNGATAKRRACDARRSAARRDKIADFDAIPSRLRSVPRHARTVTEVADASQKKRDLDKIRIEYSAFTARAGACASANDGNPNTPPPPSPPPAPDGDKALNAFCAAYPRRTWPSTRAVAFAWREVMDEGVTAAEVMRCLELAKLSKQWCEDDGRFIPTAQVWLGDRRFEALLKQVRQELSLRRNAQEEQRRKDAVASMMATIDEEGNEFD